MPPRFPRLLPSLCLWLAVAPLAGAAEPTPAASPALRLWQEGQDALLDGRGDAAIDCFQRSLRLDPTLARNFLSLAAAHAGRGEEERAAVCLERYLSLEPDHLTVRLQYADLLLGLGRRDEARAQLERFSADAQPQEEALADRLITCHSRLMALAEAAGDGYGEHLHRGIGLYLLGRARLRLGEGQGLASAEALLCQAAGALAEARLERPDEARPCWYLSQTWAELGQRQPAARWLRAAEAAAPFTFLTPEERRRLAVACRQLRAETGRK